MKIKNTLRVSAIALGLAISMATRPVHAQDASASAFAKASAYARTKGMVLMQRPLPKCAADVEALRYSTGLIFSPTSQPGEQVNVFGPGLKFRGEDHDALSVIKWDSKQKRCLVQECNNGDIMMFVVTPLEAIAQAGATGKAGANGRNGRDGRNGQDGQRGDKGDRGCDGRDGIDGLNGRDGIDGRDGRDGRDGELKCYTYNVIGVTGPQANGTVCETRTTGFIDGFLAPVLGSFLGRSNNGPITTTLNAIGTGGAGGNGYGAAAAAAAAAAQVGGAVVGQDGTAVGFSGGQTSGTSGAAGH